MPPWAAVAVLVGLVDGLVDVLGRGVRAGGEGGQGRRVPAPAAHAHPLPAAAAGHSSSGPAAEHAAAARPQDMLQLLKNIGYVEGYPEMSDRSFFPSRCSTETEVKRASDVGESEVEPTLTPSSMSSPLFISPSIIFCHFLL